MNCSQLLASQFIYEVYCKCDNYLYIAKLEEIQFLINAKNILSEICIAIYT